MLYFTSHHFAKLEEHQPVHRYLYIPTYLPKRGAGASSFLSFYFSLLFNFISIFYWAACEAGQDEEGGRGGETAREPGGGSGIAARLSSFMHRSSDGGGGDKKKKKKKKKKKEEEEDVSLDVAGGRSPRTSQTPRSRASLR